MTPRDAASSRRRGAVKVLIALGFFALAYGLLRANAHHAGGYELSIYGGTPLGFWIGAGIAVAIALVVSFAVRPGLIRTSALVLGGTAIAAIAGLPFLRGYYYHGTADALTHLGWARDMATGAMEPTELFYPGIHSFAAVVNSLLGIGIEQSVLFVVATMATVAVVFVPLAVRTIGRGDRAVVVAAFSTFLLFMVHNLGVYLHAHSFAQATFFSALVFFLAFTYLTGGSRVAVGGLLAIALLATVIFHPQLAADLILVFGAISLVQFVHRRYRSDHQIVSHRPLYAHTGFLAVAFAVWITRFEGWAFFNISRVGDAFAAYLMGRPPTAGGQFQSQAASLTAIGSGVPEIFVKLFLVATVFAVLSAALTAAALFRTTDGTRPTEDAVAVYLGAGSVALLPVIVIYFAGNIAEHYFRHIGFLLLVATIVGSLAITRGLSTVSARRGRRWAATAIVIAFAIMLPLSLATAFPSPFIHKQTQHVSEPQLDGYRTVFEVNDERLPMAGIRQGPWRYSDAVEGVAASREYRAVVTNENLTRLDETFEDGGTLVVTDRDHARETRAYEELRYTDRAFRSLDAQPGVNRVVSNDVLRMYHVAEESE